MDDQRFDALVRALGNESPRRTMLAGLGAATLGGVLSLFGQEPGQAAVGRCGHTKNREINDWPAGGKMT